MIYTSSLISLSEKVAAETEKEIISQLNDFISRNLIEIQTGPLTFVQSMQTSTVEVRRSVKLVLKDKEYVEKLEKENSELKDLIAKIKATI